MHRRFAVVTGFAIVALASVLFAPAPAVAQDSPEEVRRLAGRTRITTAVAVSEATFTSADTALLARADDYPDALTGTVLAHARQAPLLLTDRDRVPGAVTAELERLGVEQVVLLGGTTAISNGVRDDLAADHRVSRISGPTRWATAVEVAEDVAPSPDTVVLATGEQFPDAVAVSAYAAHQGWPVLLTGQDELPDEVRDYLDAAGSVRVIPVGGRVAIADAVLDELTADGHDVAPRLAGRTRWATSHRIATVHANALGAPTDLWVATGEAFPDALTAGVAAAANGALLQLTPTGALDVPDSDRDVLGRLRRQSACTGTGSLTDVIMVGGRSALSRGVHFQSWAGLTCTPLPPGRLGWISANNVWVAEPGGANARVVARDVPWGAQFSPTGRHVVTGGIREARMSLVDVTTGSVVGVDGHDPEWDHDGSRIAYSLSRDGVDADVFTVDNDGSNVRQLVTAQEIAGLKTVVGWSAGGHEVLFFRGTDHTTAPNRLYAVDVATEHVRLVADTTDERRNDTFSLSPDGTQLGLVREDPDDAQGIPDQLVVVDTATGQERVLLTRTDISPGTWSPDGSEIAVATSGGPVRIDAATGAVTPIPRGRAVLDWSPDGDRILVQEDTEDLSRARLIAVDADGAGETVLAENMRVGYPFTPVWSPDGRWVAYVGKGRNGSNIQQVRVDGQHRFQVSAGGGQFHAWMAAEG